MSPIFICCSSPANTPICVPGNVLRKLFSLLLIFLTLVFFSILYFLQHQTLIWIFHIYFLSSQSLSLSYYFSSASSIYFSFVHIFSLYIILFFLLCPFPGSVFFSFFVSGRYCGWWSTVWVWRHFSLSVCMFVCLGKDMLLTLWLSSTWKNANCLR